MSFQNRTDFTVNKKTEQFHRFYKPFQQSGCLRRAIFVVLSGKGSYTRSPPNAHIRTVRRLMNKQTFDRLNWVAHKYMIHNPG
jgi:hypothetical protein